MKERLVKIGLVVIAVGCSLGLGIKWFEKHSDQNKLHQQVDVLKQQKLLKTNQGVEALASTPSQNLEEALEILPEYEQLYHQNSDFIGWLTVEGTNIDYPVMQTLGQEDYYLDKGFDKKKNSNGSLILDTESHPGIGTKIADYKGGQPPSTNLIIHGHHMKSGEMFGNLEKYSDQKYAKEHDKIRFDTLYEKREYQVMAVFLSQVYKKSDQVFKYYEFTEADNEEAFNDFYKNIKELSLFDTGVTAQYGDEYITLSTCAYHTPNGRLVVVGKRIQ